jgi:glycosyltransferase involved in cell wall biosynthesis
VRVAVVGNLAGVANEYVIGLRSLGVEADLFLTDTERAATLRDAEPAGALPDLWLRDMPSYGSAVASRGAHRWREAARTALQELPAVRSLLAYDAVHVHTGALLTSRLARLVFVGLRMRPYVAAATGSDLREVAQMHTGRGWWMRVFFRRARLALLLNIDMFPLAEAIQIHTARFFPFAIDTETFSPPEASGRSSHEGHVTFFMMSRLDWSGGDPARRTSANENDRVFTAFARLLRTHPNSRLVVGDRGAQRAEARQLVAALGISEHVQFVPPMSRADRIRRMQAADVCLDQFGLGAYGLGALEAMAIGKPVITYINDAFVQQCGLQPMPILNAQDVDGIAAAMCAAAGDGSLRARVGDAAREWVLRHHRRETVCRRLLQLHGGAPGQVDAAIAQ